MFFDMVYWLMNMRLRGRNIEMQDMSNFNTKQEACRQLVNDLKTFTSKTEKTDQLIHGHGEHVCKVINDLLNRELIKQEFRFGDPIFKNIDEGVDMDQPDTQQSDDDASRVLPS